MNLPTQYTNVIFAACLLAACGGSGGGNPDDSTPTPTPTPTPEPEPEPEPAFYFGNDLSYVNEMEDCGARYRDNGEVTDVFDIMAAYGTNLVRVRLWNHPWWQEMIPQPDEVAVNRQLHYSNLADVTETIRRAKAADMDVMLGFHLSDFWADPGRQVVPREWEALFGDEEALSQAVYTYVTSVLETLDGEGLLPEIVKIGNESNGGMMTHETLSVEPNADGETLNITKIGASDHSEAYVAATWNAAIKAVRDFSAETDNPPKIALHVADPENAVSIYRWIVGIGVTDFDIAGFSYYYAWHEGSIAHTGDVIRQLKQEFPEYEPMIVETGYAWDDENIDGLGNIIAAADPAYTPLSKQNQLKYMVDLTQQAADAGAKGVVFWEPAWVSTACRTPWGQGSSHEHVAYFDHRDNLNFHIGGTWMDNSYMSAKPTEGVETEFLVDMSGADTSGGVFISGEFTEDTLQPMLLEGNNVYSYSTLVPDGQAGSYAVFSGRDPEEQEAVPAACSNPDDATTRTYSVDGSAEQNQFATVWESCDDFNTVTSLEVQFNVDMTGVDTSNGVYITGELNGWALQAMEHSGDEIYTATLTLEVGASGAFYFLNAEDWGARETVPAECAVHWDSDRGYEIGSDGPEVVNVIWSSCETW